MLAKLGFNMTTYHEVHLFGWIKENATIIGAFLVVAWAIAVYWYKTSTSKFLTRPEGEIIIKARIAECKLLLDGKNDQLDETQQRILKALEGLEVQINLEALENSKAHQSILSTMINRNRD